MGGTAPERQCVTTFGERSSDTLSQRLGGGLPKSQGDAVIDLNSSVLKAPLGPSVIVKSFVVLALSAAAVGFAITKSSADVLDVPARSSVQALKTAYVGVAGQHETMLAVGARGAVLMSSDTGLSWRQISLPVSSDFTTVRFGPDGTAWVLGHDAVALRSNDLGQTWERLVDGRILLPQLLDYYEARAKQGDRTAARLVRDLAVAAEQSATRGTLAHPFLDVWMGDDGEGFLAGGFGLLLRTSNEGKTWEPWLERAENDRGMHLYGFAQTQDGTLYLVGEQGLVRRYDRTKGRFTSVESPYMGTYFGAKAVGDRLIVFGLRGNAYVTADAGRTWQQLDLGVEATVIAVLSHGGDEIIFVTQAGQVLFSRDGGLSVTNLELPSGGEVLSAALVGQDAIALTRLNGVSVVPLTRN